MSLKDDITKEAKRVVHQNDLFPTDDVMIGLRSFQERSMNRYRDQQPQPGNLSVAQPRIVTDTIGFDGHGFYPQDTAPVPIVGDPPVDSSDIDDVIIDFNGTAKYCVLQGTVGTNV